MRRIVVIVPELLSESEPFLDRNLPHFNAIAEASTFWRLSQLEPVETPEARFLGLAPDAAELRQGPLTISALGADPPPRSLHFHLSLLSLDGDVVRTPDPLPTPQEMRELVEAVRVLNTRKLTFVAGTALDHGLVWEALGDMETVPAEGLLGKPLKGKWPQGDGEPMLRQYIDDSVNLLGELDFNKRRLDEGQLPVNLLWPWGQGERRPIPNLALRRGGPANVMSESLRLAGLTRLAGYRHSQLGWLGTGLHTHLASALHRALDSTSAVIVVDAITEFRTSGELDEAAYFGRLIDSDLLKPILEAAAEQTIHMLFASPSVLGLGLAIEFQSKARKQSIFPFDERSLEEPKLPIRDLESLVDAVLSAHPGEAE